MGEGVYSSALLDVLRAPAKRTVSQWANDEAHIPEGDGPRAGKYWSSVTPYADEMMDAFSDPEVESVAAMTASQIGKTVIMRNVLGYYSSDDPSPILVVRETNDAVAEFSQQKVEPFFAATPILRHRLEAGERAPRNKVSYRSFSGGFVAFAGAGSIAALSSRAIRIVLGDEVDRWRTAINVGENPYEQIEQRTRSFRGRKKLGFWSTPGVEGLSLIAELYERSDQRRYHVPCPHCGEAFVMEWEHVRYRGSDGRPTPDQAWLECPKCSGCVDERHRMPMVARGKWVPKFPERRAHRGYQLSALYSPWVTFSDLAHKWLDITRTRDSRGIVDFYGLQLGLPAPQQGTSVHVEALGSHLEHYAAEVPAGVLLLTAQVDTQDHRLEVEVCGWGLGRERWGIRYLVLPGDTSQRGPWSKLDELLGRRWETEDGRELAIRCTVIDAGGHRTNEVWKYTGPRVHRGVYAIMGRGGERPLLGRPNAKNRYKAPTYPIGADQAKNTVLSALMLEERGPGYWHWPDDAASGYDEEYFRGLLSERRVQVQHAGRTKVRWVQTRHRNEPFDLAQYSFGAVSILDPNFEILAARQAARAKAMGRRSGAVRTDSPPERNDDRAAQLPIQIAIQRSPVEDSHPVARAASAAVRPLPATRTVAGNKPKGRVLSRGIR